MDKWNSPAFLGLKDTRGGGTLSETKKENYRKKKKRRKLEKKI